MLVLLIVFATCTHDINMRYLLLLAAVLLLAANCEDEGAKRMRELRELTAKQSNNIIPADSKFFRYRNLLSQ